MEDLATSVPDTAGSEAQNQVASPPSYPFSSDIPELLQSHLDHLLGSAISLDVIRERGYKSVMGKYVLKEAGFSKSQQRAPGILIPQYSLNGSNGGSIYRPDNPRANSKGKSIKYETKSGGNIGLDTHPRCIPQLKDPSIPLFFTEGTKKVDSLVSHGVCAVGLNGVWGFKGRNTLGGTTLLADFDYLALADRPAYIVYDSDIATNRHVRQAMERLAEHLSRKGASVNFVQLPQDDNGKTGVDDFLSQGHSIAEIKSLALGDLKKLHREPLETDENIYVVHKGCNCFIKNLKDYEKVYVPMCNWSGRIRHIIVKDSGIAEEVFYSIEWYLEDGTEMEPAEVSVTQFDAMNWVPAMSKGRAYVAAGNAIKDNLRSGQVPEGRVQEHEDHSNRAEQRKPGDRHPTETVGLKGHRMKKFYPHHQKPGHNGHMRSIGKADLPRISYDLMCPVCVRFFNQSSSSKAEFVSGLCPFLMGKCLPTIPAKKRTQVDTRIVAVYPGFMADVSEFSAEPDTFLELIFWKVKLKSKIRVRFLGKNIPPWKLF
ncbi:MAG: DUF3854 domain-containing protein [Chloroflexota bacterium]|nr:DUF3854 domain-containing protein [Chloroflexota bacterium]